MTKAEPKICVGQFAGAHGVRGLVRLRSFTADPESIFAYAPLFLEDGRAVKMNRKSAGKDHFVVAVEGIGDRDAAENLRGAQIFMPRANLPPAKPGEYYDADLVGLEAVDAAGKIRGKILAVHDYGAGAFLEIGAGKKDSFMLPFKDEFVPEIDIGQGRVAVIIPEGWP